MADRFLVVVVAILAFVALGAACSSGEPPPIATGSAFGGEFGDGMYGWELRQARSNTRAVELVVPSPGGGSSTHWVYSSGSDDPVWVEITHPAVDAANLAIGGARADVDEVILVLGDGTEVPMEFLEVEGRPWNAVMAELPRRWVAAGGFGYEVVAFRDGVELARECHSCG